MKYTYIAGILSICAIVAFGSFTFGNMKIQKQQQVAQVLESVQNGNEIINEKKPQSGYGSGYGSGYDGRFLQSGKIGCMNRLACNFDSNAKVAGNCVYAVFDAQAVHPNAQTCTLSKSVQEVEKPSKVSPFNLLPAATYGGCMREHVGSDATNPEDDKIGSTYNVHLHQWTVDPSGQVLTRSTSFYRAIYSADNDISEYAGTNACAGLKSLNTKKRV